MPPIFPNSELHAMIGWRNHTAAAWLDRLQGVTALLNTKPPTVIAQHA